MRTFHATTEGQNRLGLRELLERYANEQRVADHYTLEEAADITLDCFKRAVRQELELLVGPGLGRSEPAKSCGNVSLNCCWKAKS